MGQMIQLMVGTFNCGFEIQNATYVETCQGIGGMAKES